MNLYNEDFLLGLDEDPKIALYSICKHFMESRETGVSIEDSIEAFALAGAYISANDMDIDIPILPDTREQRYQVILSFLSTQVRELTHYIQSEEEQRLLQNLRGEFSAHIKKSFVYEFSDGDLIRIQTLLNEMRDLVSKSAIFEESHRRRLLKRLEKLQRELHKKQSDLDHFWGLIGDAGIAIGKFGKEAKPFVDRIKQITDIVWRTQSRAEELPSDSKPPFLGSDQQD